MAARKLPQAKLVGHQPFGYGELEALRLAARRKAQRISNQRWLLEEQARLGRKQDRMERRHGAV